MPCALPKIRKAQRVTGHALSMRDVTVADAAFIYALRTDAERARFLSAVPFGVQAQAEWLQAYAGQTDQAYFLIETLMGRPLGAVRLYDARGSMFSWGSWILAPGAPSRAAIESALMVYHYALWLGFDGAHFEVLENNARVRHFHENFGAQLVGRADGRCRYVLPAAALRESLKKYARFLPQGIHVQEECGK